jgi:AraC-like DNA-binding protein
MKIIKELTEMIEDELEGALSYAKWAVDLKESEPAIASTFYEIAGQEMHHVNLLHDRVSETIRKHRDRDGEPPAPMMAVYEYLHSKHIDKAAEVKRYLEMYKS